MMPTKTATFLKTRLRRSIRKGMRLPGGSVIGLFMASSVGLAESAIRGLTLDSIGHPLDSSMDIQAGKGKLRTMEAASYEQRGRLMVSGGGLAEAQLEVNDVGNRMGNEETSGIFRYS